MCDDFLPLVSKGLDDTWPAVRFSACHAARSFYKIAKNREDLRKKFDPIILPAMCLNRYYFTEGVKSYA